MGRNSSSRFVLVLGFVDDLGAASVWYHGGLRHPDHHLQRLLGHRRHHLPLPRAKESEQRGRPSYAHPDRGLLLDILAVLLHGADEPPDRPRSTAEGPLRHSDLLVWLGGERRHLRLGPEMWSPPRHFLLF